VLYQREVFSQVIFDRRIHGVRPTEEADLVLAFLERLPDWVGFDTESLMAVLVCKEHQLVEFVAVESPWFTAVHEQLFDGTSIDS
jgi:hypothetical protein